MTIYFAKMGEWIKIGYTANEDASRRIAQLQTGQPQKIELLGTITGDRDAEAGLHEFFATFRVSGEWFDHEGIIGVVSFLIEHQYPWYYCRTRRIVEKEWSYAFALSDSVDRSAYEDTQIKLMTPEHAAKCINMAIRRRRKKKGRDALREEKVRQGILSQTTGALHPYAKAWSQIA